MLKSHPVLCGAKPMRFAFIAKIKEMLPVNRRCQIMDVSPRGYRSYCSRPLSASQCKDLVVLAHRRIVGWAVSNRMKRDLAIRALEMAINLRKPPKGCIHHTDRGSQYCSHDYQKILRKLGFYYARRKHSALGWKSPLAFERKAA